MLDVGDRKYDWSKAVELDHDRIVFGMVADALGLDPNICRAKGLQLMVTQEGPLSLGFRASRAFESTASSNSSTVEILQAYGRVGPLLYDVWKPDDQAEDEVVGIWIANSSQERNEMLEKLSEHFGTAYDALVNNGLLEGHQVEIIF